MRIVSLVPSASEVLLALGVGEQLVGVSAFCPQPPHGPALVSEGTTLDGRTLASLQPELIVTSPSHALSVADLAPSSRVLTVDPHTLDDALQTITALGEATGRTEEAGLVLAEQRRHLAALLRWSLLRSRPRVAFLEWSDPPHAAGRWIPELIELAGGEPVLGSRGAPSRQLTWDEVRAAAPDVVVVGACGVDRAGNEALLPDVRRALGLPDCRLLAVDSLRAWSRPGLHLAEGVEELALPLHRG